MISEIKEWIGAAMALLGVAGLFWRTENRSRANEEANRRTEARIDRELARLSDQRKEDREEAKISRSETNTRLGTIEADLKTIIGILGGKK